MPMKVYNVMNAISKDDDEDAVERQLVEMVGRPKNQRRDPSPDLIPPPPPPPPPPPQILLAPR